MFVWFRQRLRAEEGISLIEMLVSILLMGLVLAALGSTLFASMAAARQNEGLTQATAIANEELERLQVAPWPTLDPVSPPAATTVTRSGRDYTVTPFVQYPDPANTQYKRYGVTVSWIENGTTHTVDLEGRRARRSGESNTPIIPINPFRALVFTVNPDPVNLDTNSRTLASTNPVLPGNAAMMLEVEFNEAARAGSVNVAWPIPSPTSTLALTEVPGSNGTRWSGTLPSGQTYPSGWMTFRVQAAKAGTATTCTVSPPVNTTDCTESTTAAYLMAPIQNGPLYYDTNDTRIFTGTPANNGDRLCRNGGTFRLRNDNPFWLGLRGLGVDDTVTLVRTDVPGPSFDMAWTLVSGTWVWLGTATSAGSGTFTATNSTWEIRWVRTYDNLSGTIPLVFRNVNANGNSAC